MLLVDEQSLLREVVRASLSREGNLVVVGEASDGQQAIAEAKRIRPAGGPARVMVPDSTTAIVEAVLELVNDPREAEVLGSSGSATSAERLLLDPLHG